MASFNFSDSNTEEAFQHRQNFIANMQAKLARKEAEENAGRAEY